MLLKTNNNDQAFNQDFAYKKVRKNPYEKKMEDDFQSLVYEGINGEKFKGKWNSEIFKNENPLHLEIGSGFGKFMTDFLSNEKDINLIGLEHRFKRSYQLLSKLKTLTHQNYRFLRAKGERIGYLFDDNEVDALYYFFPDPWPKRRHHKKRLFQNNFLDLAHKILKPGGKFYIKTDHDEYFDWMNTYLEDRPTFRVQLKTFDLHKEHPENFLSEYKTKFEHIFLKQNIKTKALILENIKSL